MQRMYLSYVAICLIPMVVLTGALSLFMCRSYRRETASEQQRLVQTVSQAMDAEFHRARSLGQMLSDARWVKRRGAAPGLYDDQFDLRTKLDLCEDLRGYRGSGAIQPDRCGVPTERGGLLHLRVLPDRGLLPYLLPGEGSADAGAAAGL